MGTELLTPEAMAIPEDSPIYQDAVVLTALGHNGWRTDYINNENNWEEAADGTHTLKPRLRPTEDLDWVAAHPDEVTVIDGKPHIDLYTTVGNRLPDDRVGDSIASFMVALEPYYEAGFFDEPLDAPDFTESNTALVHDNWVFLNHDRPGVDERLLGSYDSLDEYTKGLDRLYDEGARELVKKRIKDGTLRPSFDMIMGYIQKDFDYFNSKDSRVPGGWRVEFTSFTADESRPGYVHIDFDVNDPAIGQAGLHLHGSYPIEDVARLVRTYHANPPVPKPPRKLSEADKTEDILARMRRQQRVAALLGPTSVQGQGVDYALRRAA